MIKLSYIILNTSYIKHSTINQKKLSSLLFFSLSPLFVSVLGKHLVERSVWCIILKYV